MMLHTDRGTTVTHCYPVFAVSRSSTAAAAADQTQQHQDQRDQETSDQSPVTTVWTRSRFWVTGGALFTVTDRGTVKAIQLVWTGDVTTLSLEPGPTDTTSCHVITVAMETGAAQEAAGVPECSVRAWLVTPGSGPSWITL